VLKQETEYGGGKRTPIISVSGEVVASTAHTDNRMKAFVEKESKIFAGRSDLDVRIMD
jgi:hypothetical protein